MTTEQIVFEKESHWTTKNWYSTIYADNKNGISKQVDVHRDANGFPTNKTRTFFYIDGSKKSYKTLNLLLDEYNKTSKAHE